MVAGKAQGAGNIDSPAEGCHLIGMDNQCQVFDDLVGVVLDDGHR
jgi:hypothetical protein